MCTMMKALTRPLKGYLYLIITLFFCLLMSGCVSTDLVKQMMKDIDQLQTENQELRQEVTALESRLDVVEAASTSDVGDVPEDQSTDDMAELFATAEAFEPKIDEAVPRPTAVSAEELYAKGQGLYSRKRYREAAQAFIQAGMLGKGPEFKARCQYWTGESMFAQGAYSRALEAFANVFVKYGSTAKAADALLKIGFTYCEMQNYNGARQALNEFLERFSDHRAVSFAREKLRWIDEQESDDKSSD